MINFLNKAVALIPCLIFFASCSASSGSSKSNFSKENPPSINKSGKIKTLKSSQVTNLEVEEKESSFAYKHPVPRQPIPKHKAFTADFPAIESAREEWVSNHLSCRRDEDCIFYEARCHHSDTLEPGREGFEQYEGIPDYFVFNNRLIRDEKNRFVFNPKNFRCLERIQKYCTPEPRPHVEQSATYMATSRCFKGTCNVDLIRSGWSFLDAREAGSLDTGVELGTVYSLTDECELFRVDSIANRQSSLTTR